ncbi:hypothetical protein [Roseisolibacter agri]|nr:hypothetical protein [Roseisolibacter agri]
MHTAEHALKPTVLLGAEELALLATRTAAYDIRSIRRPAVAAGTPSPIARLLALVIAIARGRARARR